MKMQIKSQFFPEEYRAFGNGPLAVCVERFGGINSVNLLDIYECNGKLYPDRFPLPLFSRNGESGNRPIFSSGIRFFLVDEDGVEKTFYPEYPDIYPDGFISKSYAMFLEQDAFGVNLKKQKSDKKVFALISKYHFISGNLESLKNQLAKPFSNIQWLEDKYRGEDFDRNYPFEE